MISTSSPNWFRNWSEPPAFAQNGFLFHLEHFHFLPSLLVSARVAITEAGPLSQVKMVESIKWCAWQDLNLHELPHYHLKVARLPIPPHAQPAA